MGQSAAPAQADRSQQRHPQGQFDGRSGPGRNAVAHLHCLTETVIFVPIGVAITLVGLGTRDRRRPISAYYLSFGVLYFIGLLWGYWTSPFTGSLYDGQVFTTVVRITIGLGLIGLV